MLRCFVAAAAFVMSLIAVAVAGPFEDGKAAFQRGDYATALRLWRPLAEQGDTEAQWFLGSMYDNGLGVQKDYVEALMWFRLSVGQSANVTTFDLIPIESTCWDEGETSLSPNGFMVEKDHWIVGEASDPPRFHFVPGGYGRSHREAFHASVREGTGQTLILEYDGGAEKLFSCLED